ncbi:hypothetical protein ACIPQA_33820 [Streptomyces sp. NPDC090109]|uniref:hypothetical protein n=1 Tax=unclassified Streptomyces TaxID=2593676 RepID=UPI0036CA8FB5
MNAGPYAPALLGTAVVAAALVIRTAVGEMRRPGSACEAWAFLRTRRGLCTFLAATCGLGGVVWTTAGPEHLPWALLAGLLTAHVLAGPRVRPPRGQPRRSRDR